MYGVEKFWFYGKPYKISKILYLKISYNFTKSIQNVEKRHNNRDL